jgi:predicted membrane protein
MLYEIALFVVIFLRVNSLYIYLYAERRFIMQNKLTREITLSGLLIAIGLILPTLFHMVGAGSSFSPMHIPVLIAGFTVSLPFAAAVGFLIPLLSSLFTGMPPMFPVLPFMLFELAAYGAVANLLYRKFKLNVYISLIGSMLAGRVVSAVVVWILASFFMAQLPGPVIFFASTITGSIPGIIIQIVLIPPVVILLAKNNLIRRES